MGWWILEELMEANRQIARWLIGKGPRPEWPLVIVFVAGVSLGALLGWLAFGPR